jgi:hypothetical protein
LCTCRVEDLPFHCVGVQTEGSCPQGYVQKGPHVIMQMVRS